MPTRKPRIVLYDPIDEVVYSRPVRKNGHYTEDEVLQDLLADKGKDDLKLYALAAYQGYVEAVYAQ